MAAASLKSIGAALRRFGWIFAVIAFLFVAYTAAGFWLVPRIAKSQIQSYVEQTMGRHVAVQEITFNPFNFIAEIRGFALTEADNSPVASFDLLHVDFQIVSLFNGAWTFNEVRLDKPNLSVLVGADGTLNLAKLQPKAAPNAQPAANAPAALPAIRIGSFTVHEGRVSIEDRSRAQAFATTLTPVEFTLNDFRTLPDFQNRYRFEGSTTAGERLTWSGQFSVRPLGSTGQFAIASLKAATVESYLQDALPVRLASGTIDVDGKYRVTLAQTTGVALDLSSLKLHGFDIAPKGVANAGAWISLPEAAITGVSLSLPEQKVSVERIELADAKLSSWREANTAPWISLPKMAVTGVALALSEQKVSVDRVELADAKLSVWREANGQPNLMRLLPPPPKPAAAGAKPAPSKPFAISVGAVAIQNASVAAEDRMMKPVTKFALTPLTLTVSGYSSDPANVLKIDASVTVNGKGKVTALGDLRLDPMITNMTVDAANIDLTPLQPYIATMSGVVLNSGQVSAKGKVALNPAPQRGRSKVQFNGDVTVANLVTRDTSLRQDFVKWQRLQVTGIDFRQGPDSLSIDQMRVSKPYGKVVISSDQTLNVVAVLSPPGSKPAVPAPAAAPAKPQTRAAARTAVFAAMRAPRPQAKTPAQPQAMPIRIRQVMIEDGSADFSDFSVQPNFSAAIIGLGGTVTGMSSAPDTRAQVKLTGSVDRYAPVDIDGTVNLLSAAIFTDIGLNFRNMELTTFNPYSGKYAGYNISKGKLTTELHYKVENRKLDAQHHIVLDQLEFGQATDSKDAVPLPVRLAVALLKDRNGVIDLNLPVSGSLDDPQFKIGPIIWQAFVGLLTKIVEAPFTLIGSLFGGGEELAYVDFAPGSAMLAATETDKIAKIAKGLAERPELRLDIPLRTLTPADDAAMAEAAFNEALEPLLPMGATATPPQRMAALAQLYQKQLGMKPAYPKPDPAAMPQADPVQANIAFLEQALKPRFTASDDGKEALTRARANAVQAAVLAQEGVMPERVFLSERESGKGSVMGARMELNLQ